jgi:CheY-like chemotaxis protein
MELRCPENSGLGNLRIPDIITSDCLLEWTHHEANTRGGPTQDFFFREEAVRCFDWVGNTRLRAHASRHPSPEVFVSQTRRILLAEDNANDAELTLAALARQKLADEVVVVRDGAEVLDYLYRRGEFARRNDGPPAAIILDIKMPKVGGLEVLRVIKGDPGLKTLPIVMLTSSREQGDLLRSYELGVNAYVVKPVDFGEFSSAVSVMGAFWMKVNEAPPCLP